MDETRIHSGEILFVKSVKDGIPNRDPLRDSDARRVFGGEDGRISLSDVSIKRDVRDYVQARFISNRSSRLTQNGVAFQSDFDYYTWGNGGIGGRCHTRATVCLMRKCVSNHRRSAGQLLSLHVSFVAFISARGIARLYLFSLLTD